MMMLRIMAFSVMMAGTISAFAADPAALLAGPRSTIEKADYRASGRLVHVDESGKRTTDEITIRAHSFSGVLRILLDISAPANAREHVLLEMKPNGPNTIHIAHPGDKAATTLAFEKWSDGPVGSGFSYEDFFEEQYFWPHQAAETSEKRGARDCDVLKSQPGAETKTHYASVKTWLDHTIDFPVYVEKTVKQTGAVKEFTSFNLRHDGGMWSAEQIEEKDRGKPGSTLLIISHGSPKANLTLADFSSERLVHF